MIGHYMALAILLASSGSTIAQRVDSATPNERRNAHEQLVHPALTSDAIVVLVPRRDMDLHRPQHFERVIDGQITTVEKGNQPGQIILNAQTMIMPLEASVPVRMFLKRFKDRDAYYPIAILEVAPQI